MADEMNQEQEQKTPQQQVEELLGYIEDLMAEEDYSRAQDILNNALRLDHFDIRIYERYAFVLRMMGMGDAAELFEKVAFNPNDPQPLFELARALMKDKMYGVAINPLLRVSEMVPMAAAVNFELGYAYMKEFDIPAARRHFEYAYELEQSPATAYYLGYVALLQNDISITEQLIGYMDRHFETTGEEKPPTLQMLKDMMARYEAFPEPQTVRDWHFIQYGTPLLRLSKEDLGDDGDLNGRYVFINYGFGSLAIIMETFTRLIREVPGFPQFEYIIPASYNAAPLAFALSKMLEIPLAPVETLQSERKGLMVTDWTADVDAVAGHIAHNPNVTLFSFALDWTNQAHLTPEVIGYFDQAHRMPWESTVVVEIDGTRTQRPAMEEKPEELAEMILGRLEKIREEDGESIDAVIAYYKERARLLKVGAQMSMPRMTFQVESPIESVRMMF